MVASAGDAWPNGFPMVSDCFVMVLLVFLWASGVYCKWSILESEEYHCMKESDEIGVSSAEEARKDRGSTCVPRHCWLVAMLKPAVVYLFSNSF